ncbi:hypothetical protein H6P81_007484 [Aristolochia fimbriata]|uniref:PWI domain-containing protein n=1 Tax=Aristolochia fimbriata TaxID=158543 RepID=A0AAV7F0E1_ARIFI|nr:hypothetical protein H6P81_007484 [Aristolochia fimbriata]
MSGGFFRGTSADQDTRFSNKQAKLLKSQKFAPELEHLVDMTKVKIDVIKPWIASRATELLGFEDEVLINFIYGLLDGKDVDGKQIQIQLTGFMEKNTGKFMKELWALLLSAQKNASGIPQQFLDAKAEETRKKKEESDRITLEIQRKKEKEGRDHESTRKPDGVPDLSRVAKFSDGDFKKNLTAPEEERGLDERNGLERRIRNSPSPIRSGSKSMSHSRSDSDERQKSRSISRSPPKRRRSISPGRHYRSAHKHSVSPQQRQSPKVPRSPETRRLSPHSRRRSPSPRRRRSPSPRRRRSPSLRRRRSPSPRRRRSPSPRRRRSPSPRRRRVSPRRHRSPSLRRLRSPSLRRLRSPSPRRRRSPPSNRRRSPPLNRRKSPSPLREKIRSPLRRRSPPIRRRSPSPLTRRSPSPRWRSPLPFRRHSPSPLKRRSPPLRSPRQRRRSPVRSSPRRAADSQSPPLQNNRSRSPYRSPIALRNGRSLSSDHDDQANGASFRKSQDDFASRRIQKKRSSVSPASSTSLERDGAERSGKGLNSRQAQISLRSPQRDPRELPGPHKGLRPERSPSLSLSPPSKRKESPVVDRSSSGSPYKQPGKRAVRYNSPESSKEEIDIHCGRKDPDQGPVALRKKASMSPMWAERRRLLVDSDHDEYALGREPTSRSEVSRQRSDETSPSKVSPERRSQRTLHISEEVQHRPGRMGKESLDQVHDELPLAKHRMRPSYSPDENLNTKQVNPRESSRDDYRVHEKRSSTATNDEYGGCDQQAIEKQKSTKKMGHNDGMDSYDSDSEKKETSRSHKIEKRKYKKIENNVDDEYDSQMDERKEAKRRRKEEKRLRKEEKRRRREERRRKKEERRAGKLKTKHVDTVTPPSDVERNRNLGGETDDDVDHRRVTHSSDSEGRELEEKKLEIELRNKALETLRAKKAISH